LPEMFGLILDTQGEITYTPARKKGLLIT
jgi:hypothetical protein